MKKTQQWKTRLAALLLAGGLGLTGAAQAALHDRGGGLIYDDLLDITWLQDANYGARSVYDDGTSTTDGEMSWDNAVDWADGLSYYDTVRAVTWDDWRLPTVGPVNGIAFDYNWSTDGSTDHGYNISAPGSAYPGSTASELAHLYYTTLGNLSSFTISGNYQPGSGVNNSGPFYNIESYTYWSGTEYALDPSYAALGLGMFDGGQVYDGKYFTDHAWAVRDGDVGAVPVPAAVWLFGSGLIGLLGVAGRRGAA